MRKFIFPFINSQNRFLLEKWWFRLLIVLYVITFLILPFYLGLKFLTDNTDWCYDTLYLYDISSIQWEQQFGRCQQIARDAWLPAIAYGLVVPTAFHYIIQVVFYKIIIGFIVLGGKRN